MLSDAPTFHFFIEVKARFVCIARGQNKTKSIKTIQSGAHNAWRESSIQITVINKCSPGISASSENTGVETDKQRRKARTKLDKYKNAYDQLITPIARYNDRTAVCGGIQNVISTCGFQPTFMKLVNVMAITCAFATINSHLVFHLTNCNFTSSLELFCWNSNGRVIAICRIIFKAKGIFEIKKITKNVGVI